MDVWGVLTWVGDKVLASLIIAIAFSWIVALLIERHRAERDFLSKEVELSRAALQEFWTLNCSYWTLPGSNDLKPIEEKILFLEEEIRSGTIDLGEYLGSEFRQQAVTLCAKLSNASTGGTFGDPTRTADPTRLTQIRESAVPLRHLLQKSRRKNLQKFFGARMRS